MKHLLFVKDNLNSSNTTNNSITTADGMNSLTAGTLGIVSTKGVVVAGAGETVAKDDSLIFIQGKTGGNLNSVPIPVNRFKVVKRVGVATALKVMTITVPATVTADIGKNVDVQVVDINAPVNKTNRSVMANYIITASGEQNTVATKLKEQLALKLAGRATVTVSNNVITVTGLATMANFAINSGSEYALTLATTTAHATGINTAAQIAAEEKFFATRKGYNPNLGDSDLYTEPFDTVAGTLYTVYTLSYINERKQEFRSTPNLEQFLRIAVPNSNALITVLDEIFADLLGVADLVDTGRSIVEAPSPAINTAS